MRKQINLIFFSSLLLSTAVFAASGEDFPGGETTTSTPLYQNEFMASMPSGSLSDLRLQLGATELDSWAPRLSAFFKKRSKFQPSVKHEITAFDEMMDAIANVVVDVFRAYDDPKNQIDTFFQSPSFLKCIRTLSLTGKIRSVEKTLSAFKTSLEKTSTKTYVLDVSTAGTGEVSWNSSGSA